MKFLCVPCDSPMKLQTVGPPERGSLSIVYACPECGYEMAMLTNAYETQVVQSLGVRIGPGIQNGATETETGDITPGKGCPFTNMIPTGEGALYDGARSAPAGAERGNGGPASDGVGGSGGAKPPGLDWTAAAEARLEKVPAFVRPMARTGIEQFARERGALEVDETILDAAREFFGM
jgi:hypothetical protein